LLSVKRDPPIKLPTPFIPEITLMKREIAIVCCVVVLLFPCSRCTTVLAQNAESPKEITNSIGMKLVLIPRGTFTMGSPDRYREREVTISRDYYLGAYEVTQAQYEKLMGANPSGFRRDQIVKRHPETGRILRTGDYSNHPVESVSWYDAMEFCKRLSELSNEKKFGHTYRLPTQAEWEYACRAGSQANYSFGNNENELQQHAWYLRNSGQRTHPVGQKKPNAWGLYDMHGNVWEWCSDWRKERRDRAGNDVLALMLELYLGWEIDSGRPPSAAIDPVGPADGVSRVYRGGSWGVMPSACIANAQYGRSPEFANGTHGFRLALSLSGVRENLVVNDSYSQAIEEYEQILRESPANDQIRFRLGVSQFLQTLETLGQAWYRHGQVDGFLTSMVPLLRLDVPENPRPEPISYDQFRAIIQQTLDRLQVSEATLAEIKSHDVAIELDLANINMDWVADPNVDRRDNLLRSFRRVIGNRVPLDPAQGFVVRFDAADVQWLRGYCHLLMALCEFSLAYDQEDFWNVIARRMFSRAQTPFDFLDEESPSTDNNWNMNLILDGIAGIHQLRFPVQEPERMPRALAHVKQTIQLSRDMWELVEAETDNDREWIPNPRQRPPFSGGEVSAEMIVGWHEFLDEAEAILDGKMLVPFWRGKSPKRGVNIHRFFVEPSDFDLVLWFHGSGAVKYLQDDLPVTSPQTWERFQRIFRGEFIGFAIWFN